MEDEALASFMEATGCSLEDAFDRLASCGGHLGKAVNTFFSIDAGPSSSSGSGSRRHDSPPPPPRVSVSKPSSEDDDDAVRAPPPVPAARRTRVSRWDSETRVGGGSHTTSPPSPSADGGSGSSARVSRWDSKTWISRHRQRGGGGGGGSGTPRRGDHDGEADGGHNSGRRRGFREDIFSSDGSDEDDEESNNTRRRRRLNPPAELTSSDSESDDGEDVHVISSDESDDDDDDDGGMLEEMEEAPRRPPPPPPPSPRNRRFEDLFKVPHELTYKGGFHAAKAHAARQARWLLANVQSMGMELPSLLQNRDVWGNDLVARCVRDRLVLWQANAAAGDDGDDGQSEAKKVLGYYGIQHDQLPVVVVVDPVTGQAMDVLHGSAAYVLNDFMARLEPYKETTPTIPGKATTVVSASPSAGGVQSNTRPATTTAVTTAPMSFERAAVATAPPVCQQTGQEQQAPTTTTVAAKPAVAVAPASCTAAGQQPESEDEKVCKVRVRLADGRVVTKEFGSKCPVSALFAYCRSMMGGAGGAPATATAPPFRLRRIVGGATEEISDQNASFENMGLHLTTVSVHLV